jgi:spermidine synthase
VRPWEKLERAHAPDGTLIELMRRDDEYLLRAGGYDLMSSGDDVSGRALATHGCAHVAGRRGVRVLVGGLGMGFTLREALDRTASDAVVEVAEFVPEVVDWNRGPLGELAGRPLSDPRTELHVADVARRIETADGSYDAVLLDVDNGPDALAHERNEALYGPRGLVRARRALVAGGVLGVWSFDEDDSFTSRLNDCGFHVRVERVAASRKGRGRYHFVWVATAPGRGDR